MSEFNILLANPEAKSPAIVQECAERSFANQVSLSRLGRRIPSQPIPAGVYVVVGVATYAPPELAFLDEIDARWQSWKDNVRIDVFSVLECKSMEDFQDYLPGIDHDVYQSPVIGVWTAGRLIDEASGFNECRNLLRRINVLNTDLTTT